MHGPRGARALPPRPADPHPQIKWQAAGAAAEQLGKTTGAAGSGTRARRRGAGVVGLQRRPLSRERQVATGARPASTSTSRLRHGGGSGPPQRRHPRPAATALSPHARARHARARRSVMTERALPVMTERIASGGAASLTAALPREGVHGRRHTPKHRREGHGQRRQHLDSVRGDGSLLPLSLGHARRAARGGSQALESCRPAALAAARCGASVDFTHTHYRGAGAGREMASP